MNEKRKHIYLDILKIIACFLVIVNHTNSVIFLNSEPSKIWFGSLLYFYISKVAVPIFILCTGALSLAKIQSDKKIIFNIVRALIALVSFSFIYYLYNNKFTDISIRLFLKEVYSSQSTGAFWYMYLYLSIMVALPFLQRLNKAMENKYKLIYIFISVGFLGIYPIIIKYIPSLKYSISVNMDFFATVFGLLICGNYLHENFVYRKRYIILSIISIIAGISISMYATYYLYLLTPDNVTSYLFFDNRYFITITAPSISLYYLVMCFAKKVTFKHPEIISYMGRCTFGIYLLSDLYTNILGSRVYGLDFISKMTNPIHSVIVFQITIFIAGFITTSIMLKIPILKKLI